MSIIKKMRKQKAIYWKRTGIDQFSEPEFAAPVEVACRWDDKSELFRSPEGREVVSRAIVYPDRDMDVGDYLLKATQAEFDAMGLDDYSKARPQDIEGAFPVRSPMETPNLRATESLFTMYL